MRYGGLGGLGGLPPTRFGSPNSQQVLSDDEFTAKWQETAPPQYIGGGTAAKQIELVPGASGYDATSASKYHKQIFDAATKQKLLDAGASAEAITPDVLSGYQDAVGGMNTFFKNSNYAYADWGANNGSRGSHKVTEYTNTPRQQNPAWNDWNDQFQSALGQRQENQTRQQQAYNTMINNGADNGLMPEGYSRPGYGQISGQTSAFNSDGGTQLGGVDNSFTSGAYTPEQGSGVYNPNPYGPNSFKKNNWQL